MTNTQIVRRAQALEVRISKLNNKICDLGFGYMPYSELRASAHQSTTIPKLIKLLDEKHALRMEADARYGPGLITVDQLIWK